MHGFKEKDKVLGATAFHVTSIWLLKVIIIIPDNYKELAVLRTLKETLIYERLGI